MTSVVILDYGSGNVRSAQRAVETTGAKVSISADFDEALEADALLVPGVGAFSACVQGIKNVRGEQIIGRRLAGGRPVLGICVGMQLFSEQGYEEQVTEGFGWIKGSVKKIEINNKDLKLPHMGWNEVNVVKKNDLFLDIKNLSHFYFVHSFAFEAKDEKDVICTTDYENPVVAGILKENIFGTQFHPEKSQSNGIKLLSNFLNWNLL